MSEAPFVYTTGQGFEMLERYFDLFSSRVPHKIPRDQSKWADRAKYDAPHGFVTLWKGAWYAEVNWPCVESCKERLAKDKWDIAMTRSPEELVGFIQHTLPHTNVWRDTVTL